MTQRISSDSITTSFADGKSSYQLLWSIPDWRSVRQHQTSINAQKAIFETGTSSWFQTKWLIGFKTTLSSYPYCNISETRLYWQLLDIRGTNLDKFKAKVQSQLLAVDGTSKHTHEIHQEVSFGEMIEETEQFQGVFQHYSDNSIEDLDYIDSDGKIKFRLVVTLKTPEMNADEYQNYKLHQFVKKSNEQFHLNFASILNDDSAADFKIVTSDKVELLAHKIILKAQCPVFAGMLNSDLSENSSGVVMLDDISADTMKVILHYFYTGELLISMDAGNIVEFTYAAGKYQMTTILGLLDDLLGRNEKEEATFIDVQLLSLAEKLSLKTAEAKLLERINAKIQKVIKSDELYKLFGFERDEMFQIAEMLANEKFGEASVLETMDYLLGGNDHDMFLETGLPLLALLQKRSLKMFGKSLLKLFASKAKKFKSSEELFAVFGRGKQI